MSVSVPERSALKDFNDAFNDAFAGKPRQKNRGPQYIRSYKRASSLRTLRETGGEDMGSFGRSTSSRKRG